MSAEFVRTLNHVIATREGLVGKTTASGDPIGASDVFVALPSRAALYRCVRLVIGRLLITAPVLDVGPWFTDDEYWLVPGRPPRAETLIGQPVRDYTCNGAGIDLSDGLIRAIGAKPEGWWNPRVLWWWA